MPKKYDCTEYFLDMVLLRCKYVSRNHRRVLPGLPLVRRRTVLSAAAQRSSVPRRSPSLTVAWAVSSAMTAAMRWSCARSWSSSSNNGSLRGGVAAFAKRSS